MSTYTAQELIYHAKARITAEAAIMARRPEGMPRAAWRMENKIDIPQDFQARDTAYKSKPIRSLWFDCNGNPYDLWVWSTGNKPQVIERIYLRDADADARLRRYERV